MEQVCVQGFVCEHMVNVSVYCKLYLWSGCGLENTSPEVYHRHYDLITQAFQIAVNQSLTNSIFLQVPALFHYYGFYRN